MAGRLDELGEFGLVAAVTAGSPPSPAGPGDDAAVVAVPDGRVVATTDVLVEGRHFRLDWSAPYDVGRKAAAQSLADVAAMGARPVALLVGFGAPGSFVADDAVALARGLADEAAACGASVVGGDVVAAPAVVVSVTALGSLDGRAPVLRSGARVGDVVVVAGALGGAAAGLAALTAGRDDLAAVAAHRVPSPPYADGVALAEAGATSMIDVSDGLSGDLRHVAVASGVGFSIDVSALPVHASVGEAAAALGIDEQEWVLGGGDDHALVATLPAPDPRWPVVGRVVEGDAVEWVGARVAPRAWEHFA
ncbi:MAG TPA: thiamine-phosphate kinase [Frankiaceae bacterium]|nr:thiamine-phosphate kinase [Frankiaceae bacterium]